MARRLLPQSRVELLQIADAVAPRQVHIDKQVVLSAMEEALQRAAERLIAAPSADIKVDIGSQRPARPMYPAICMWSSWWRTSKTEISLVDARFACNPDARVGDIIAETLPPVDFNRISASERRAGDRCSWSRDAGRERQYDEYQGPHRREVVHRRGQALEFGSVGSGSGAEAEGVVRPG